MSSSAEPLSVEKLALHCPPLHEVASVLQCGLSRNFGDVQVSVVDCPDLTQNPFSLAAAGLCGSPRLVDVGGVPYLMPLAQKNKKYNLCSVAEKADLPGALIIGAGCGPWQVVGCNSEMMTNIKVDAASSKVTSGSYTAKVDPKDDSYILERLHEPECCVLMNVFLSEGKPGKVLEVKASKRTGPDNYMLCLRQSLAQQYGSQPVALGGTFLIEHGKAKIHVMPDFSSTPITSDEGVNNWLRFYEMRAPLTCLGYVISADPGLDLRMEHFHCYSTHGDGGHYHYDTTPDDVKYRGYFAVPEYVYRVDRPQVTHDYGRD